MLLAAAEREPPVAERVGLRRRVKPGRRDGKTSMRNGPDLATLIEDRRQVMFEERHEGLDRDQSSVTRADTVTPICFERVQKVQDQRCIQLLETEL
jgi:hypothetical protein